MTKRQNLSLLIVALQLAFAAGAFAEGGGRYPINFDGGPGCGSLKLMDDGGGKGPGCGGHKIAFGGGEAVMEPFHAITAGVAAGIKNLNGTPVLPDLSFLQDGKDGPIIDPEPAAVERLWDAQAQLKAIIADYNARIARETDDAAKVSLYKMRDKAQWGLDQVTMALEKLAKDGAKNDKQAKLDALMSQAAFLNKVMSAYLGTPGTFSDTWKLRDEDFDLEVGGDAIYELIVKRIPFLGGAVRGRIRIRSGEQMVSQFNSLKSEYYTVLLDASQTLRDMGKKPAADKRLIGLTSWGYKTGVVYPDTHDIDSKPILTSDQRDSIID